MKKATLLMAAMLVVALVAATAFVTDSALAYEYGDEKKKTQAVSGVNDCGNGDNPIDVFCQNVPSEIQGDGNSATISGSQGD